MIEPAPADEVHLWIAETSAAHDPARREGYARLLSPEEAARLARFRHAGARDEFLVGRALVRTTLSRYARLAPEAWCFRLNAHGRPDIAEYPDGSPRLIFNLSHTRGLVVCAVTVARELGVDVEYTGRVMTRDIADRFFAPAEVRALRALPTAEQPRAFFDYWTLKEAYIKARGLGLALPLHQFAFACRAGGPASVRFSPELEDEAESWQFWQSTPGPDHQIAVAVRRRGADLPVRVTAVVPEAPA